MTRKAFLTPENLTGDPVCYQISIPVRLFEFVLGALLPLGESWNWEQEGSVTPEDAAEYFSEWIYGILATGCSSMVVKRFAGEQVSAQTFTTNVAATINIDNSVWNSSYFSFNAASDEITLLNDGHYVISANLGFAANATGRRGLFLNVGGENVASDVGQASPQGVSGCSCSYARQLAAGTVVYMTGVQNSGGNLLANISGKVTSLSILYFGPEV